MGSDGFPLSWRHYVYGLRYLGRAHVRHQLTTAEAVRLGGAARDDYTAWRGDMNRILGAHEARE